MPTLLAIIASSLFAWDQAQVTHQLGRPGEAVQVAQFGHERGGIEQRHSAQTHQRPHHRFPPPAGHLTRDLHVETFQLLPRLADTVHQLLQRELLRGVRHFDARQIPQVRRRPRRGARVTKVVPQQKHFELLASAVLRSSHLVASPQQIPHGFILRLGNMNA